MNIENTLNAVFLKRCVFCGEIMPDDSEGYLCEACHKELNLKYTEFSESKTEPLDGIVHCLRYEDKIRSAIIRYKFYGAQSYHKYFGYLMYKRLKRKPNWKIDAITYVPMGLKRMMERGFNQSELLGREIGKLSGLPVEKTLRKKPLTKRQANLPAEKRRENVRNKFSAVDSAAVDGKSYLLVDDVYTTGSTAAECAGALKGSGAARVYCITLAKTVQAAE